MSTEERESERASERGAAGTAGKGRRGVYLRERWAGFKIRVSLALVMRQLIPGVAKGGGQGRVGGA